MVKKAKSNKTDAEAIAEGRERRAWAAALLEIRAWQKDRKKRFPHLPTIAKVLRGDEEIPREMRIFLADLIDAGKLRQTGTGRPKLKNSLEQDIEEGWANLVFREEYERISMLSKADRRKIGKETPYELALEETQKRLAKVQHHISTATLRKIVDKVHD